MEGWGCNMVFGASAEHGVDGDQALVLEISGDNAIRSAAHKKQGRATDTATSVQHTSLYALAYSGCGMKSVLARRICCEIHTCVVAVVRTNEATRNRGARPAFALGERRRTVARTRDVTCHNNGRTCPAREL